MAQSADAPAQPAPQKPPTKRELRESLDRANLELAVAEAAYTRGLFAQLDRAARALEGSGDLRWLGEQSNFVGTDAEPGWVPIGGGASTQAKHLPELRPSWIVRNQMYRLWRLQPHARGILRNFQRFVIGKGFGADFADTATGDWADPARTALKPGGGAEAQTLVRLVYKDFDRRVAWRQRAKEIVLRTFRDGEAFVRRFVRGGRVTLRFIEPERVASGDSGEQIGLARDAGGVRRGDLDGDDRVGEATKVLAGIEFLADDVETVVAYHVALGYGPSLGETTRIPAREIHHFKALADAGDLRGIPLLECVARRIVNYDTWEEYRVVLNKVRTAVALVRKVEGTAVQAAALIAGRAAAREEPHGLEPQTISGRREAAFRAGTVLTPGPGVTYDFISPNLQARDAGEDGRRILLAVAAGVGLPEMLVTGDWSNGNFASSVEARTPAVREWEDWQEFFEVGFERILGWVLEGAMGRLENWDPARSAFVPGGSLGLPEDTDTEVTLQWPGLINRDRLKETERNMNLNAANLLSKQTWSVEEDLVYDDEQENFREEAEADLERQAAMAPEPPTPGAIDPATGLPLPPTPVPGPRGGGGAVPNPAPRGERPTVESLQEAIDALREGAAEVEDPGVRAALGRYAASVNRILLEAGGVPLAEEAAGHEYGSTQVNVPDAIAVLAKRWVADHVDQADQHPDHELPDEHHVTVRYGLAPEARPIDAAAVVRGHGPIPVRLGMVSGFTEHPEHDVLVVDVESPGLHDLNRKLGALPHEDTQPGYRPHMTLAYLRKGTAAQYLGDPTFQGKAFTARAVTLSPADGRDQALPLTEQVDSSATSASLAQPGGPLPMTMREAPPRSATRARTKARRARAKSERRNRS